MRTVKLQIQLYPLETMFENKLFSPFSFTQNSMQLNLGPDCNRTSITILGNTGKLLYLSRALKYMGEVSCYFSVLRNQMAKMTASLHSPTKHQ